MVQIRRLNCFDYPKLKKLISYLCTDDNDRLGKSLVEEPVGFLNAILPLSLKFKSESFILMDDKEILGLITVICTPGNPYKINITRLIFKENQYDIGKSLVDYVIQKYGAKGASAFMVTIDQCQSELFDLFINGCGFRQCASETLWKIERPVPQKSNIRWRYAQNSDSKKIAQLYNSEVINIYKPSLLREENEFKEPFFHGFSNCYKNRYVIEDDSNINVYFSVTTSDNLNYILDITANSGYEYDYNQIINAMLCEIALKKKAFYPIIKQKNYIKKSEEFGQFLKDKNYIPIQTQQILVKDFYRQISEPTSDWQVFILGESQISR